MSHTALEDGMTGDVSPLQAVIRIVVWQDQLRAVFSRRSSRYDTVGNRDTNGGLED